jgi:serine/threonine-protein kinase
MRADLLRAAAGRPVSATPVYSSQERTQIIGGNGGRRGTTTMIPTEPVEQPRRNRGLTWLLVALGVIAVFALAAFATSYLMGGNDDTVPVPTVTGKPVAEARQTLEADGFKVSVQQRASTEEQKGLVLSQSPTGGDRVDKGTTVTLTVGAGPAQTTVPDLKGLDQAGAEQALSARKLKGNFVRKPGPRPEGTVLTFTPGAGTPVAENSTVTVEISDGTLRLVPQVVDLSQADAEARIVEAGLTFAVQEAFSEKAPGIVIAQTPAQNTQQKEGTRVTITVSRGPRPTPSQTPSVEPSQEPDPTPTPTPTPTTASPTPIIPRPPGG